MSTKVIGHAITLISPQSFTHYAKGMGKQFRGFATLEASTVIADGKIKGGKGSGFSGRIQKNTRCQVVLNPHYANSVNNQRGRETEVGEYMEEFVAIPRSWGTRIEGTSFVEHRGKTYLEVQVLRSLTTEYFIDGQPVPNDVAQALLHAPRESKRQTTDKAVILRDYNVENITRVKWTSPEGVEYDLTIEA